MEPNCYRLQPDIDDLSVSMTTDRATNQNYVSSVEIMVGNEVSQVNINSSYTLTVNTKSSIYYH